MKYRELEGVEDRVKIRGVNWNLGFWIRWTSSGIFIDHQGRPYPFNGYDAMVREWEYYQEPEPELFCPVCGAKGLLYLCETHPNKYHSRCSNNCIDTKIDTKEKLLEIWKKIGGVR